LVEKFGAHNNFIIILGDTGILGLIGFLFPAIFMVHLTNKGKFLQREFRFDKNYVLFLAYSSAFIGLFFAGLIRTYYVNLWSAMTFVMAMSYYRILRHSYKK